MELYFESRRIQADQFNSNGFVVVEDVLDVCMVEDLRIKAMNSFRELFEVHLNGKNRLGIGIKNGFKEIVQRHQNRFEVPYKIDEIGGTELAMHPKIVSLVDSILGEQHHVVNISLVVSNPGAADQSWHTDGPHVSVTQHLPCHCLNVFVPLIDILSHTGPTSFRPGSQHLTRDFRNMYLAAFFKKKLQPVQTPELKRGSVLMFDYRVLHRGTANTSSEPRPVIVLTFAKPWFQDTLNFPRYSIYDSDSISNVDEGPEIPEKATCCKSENDCRLRNSSSISLSPCESVDSQKIEKVDDEMPYETNLV